MTPVRLAFTELERLLSGGLARLAVLSMILVPALFGSLYLYANHDPYDGLSRVPAAIVVLDEGAAEADGEQLNAGQVVAEALEEDDAFDWQLVDEDDAEDGVEDGSYEFALVIPAGFSAALAAPSGFEPEQARLVVTTNDAGSFVSAGTADRITASVRDALAERVGAEASGGLLIGLTEVRDTLSEAATSSGKLRDGATGAAKGAARLEREAGKVVDRARDVGAGSGQVSGSASRISTTAAGMIRQYELGRVALVRRMFQAGLNETQRRYLLQAYDLLGRELRVGNARLQAAANDVGGPATGSDRLTAGARELAREANRLHGDLVDLRQRSAQLDRGLRDGVKEIPAAGDSTRTGLVETIADPVEVQNVAETEADTYGEGLAPLFLALAAWIGGFALFLLVRPLSTRAVAANQAPARVAVGGWLTPAVLGALQVALLGGVVFLAVDIAADDIPLALGFLLLTSATFIAIVHCLNAWFGVAGQFLGLALLVLQGVTAGGAFPWQTLPEPLHWLHHALPLSYAVDGLRQLMYGGSLELAGVDAAVLAAWLVGALVLTTFAARRQRTWTVKRIKPELAL